MRFRPRLAAAAAAMAVAALSLAACGDDDAKTLTFTERDTDEFAFLDNPPKSKSKGEPELSKGDQLTFKSDYLDSAKKDVGDLDATCIITASKGGFETSTAQCLGTATLKGGSFTLAVGGEAFGDDAKGTVGSILGGTGKYAGASGTFTSKGDEPATSTFEYTLP